MVVLAVVVEVAVLHRHHRVIVKESGVHYFHKCKTVLMFELSLATLSCVQFVVAMRE